LIWSGREKKYFGSRSRVSIWAQARLARRLFNARSSELGYWDHPIKEIKAGEAEMHFIDHFDWNQMDYQDFQYYRAKIASFPAHPETVGLEVLLERSSYSVFLKGQ
jgi:hypothetical protein